MEIQIFDDAQFGQLRGMNINGEAWLMATDVARKLGYTNPQKAIRDHVDDEDKTLNVSFTVNGTTPVLINESGLYALILSSKMPQAREFKHWVTSEVLPQIRKTGGYIPTRNMQTGEELSDLEIMALAVKIQQRTIEERERRIAGLESSVALLSPKAEYCDEVLDSVDCMTTTQVAKGLGMSAQELNQWLCNRGVQYWQSGQYLLYADYARRGFAKNRTHSYQGTDGMHSRSYLVWTERGREFITRMINDSLR